MGTGRKRPATDGKHPVPRAESRIALFVDLETALLRTGVVAERLLAAVRESPSRALAAILSLLHGRSAFRESLARLDYLGVDRLPLDESVVAYLREEARSGRCIYLIAEHEDALVEAIARRLGFFCGTAVCRKDTDVSGSAKLAEIKRIQGSEPFEYVGGDLHETMIWRSATGAVLVGVRRAPDTIPETSTPVRRVLERESPNIADVVRALRPHQWLKNLLVFIPLLAAQEWSDSGALSATIAAFFAFSLVASATYVFNDLLDLNADRGHPRKRSRPFAAGKLRAGAGLGIIALLISSGLLLTARLPPPFLGTVLTYVALTIAYSVHLKTYVLIDVLTLASLYTLRIIGGVVALSVPMSNWLLAFSMFLFFSIALAKRDAELHGLVPQGRTSAESRDYSLSDRNQLQSLGSASGCVAVLVLALYINSDIVVERYSRPYLLWLLCPLLLYWIGRIWIKAGRGEMHDDPLIFTLRDRGSRFVVLASVLITLAAA